jgi:hypothetical protein
MQSTQIQASSFMTLTSTSAMIADRNQSSPRSSMFRFTIRDVLWLMVVVGLGIAWWLERIPKSVDVFPHELSQLCEPGERVKVTIVRGGYDASSPTGSEMQSVRTKTERIINP